MLPVKHLSKESFIKLVRYIKNDLGVKKIFFSQDLPLSETCKVPVTPFARIDICLTGEKHMRFACDGEIQDVFMKPGEMHYCPPLCWKLPLWDTSHTMSSLLFTPEYIRFTYINHDQSSTEHKHVPADVFYHTSKPLSLEGNVILNALNVHSASGSNPRIKIKLMEALLELTLDELENDHPRTYNKGHITWVRINQYLQDNFCYPINREHVAKELQLDPSHISRLFAEKGRGGFTATLRRLRMEHAAVLLKNTSMSVKEICNECGYLSSTFFISAFKKHFGVPPGKYRCQVTSPK